MGLDVVVVGSINFDISVFSPRHPGRGETVIGTGHIFGPGGKGANQAVAAARLGARVGLVGRVGADDWGSSLLDGLISEGVDVSGVGIDDEVGTGVAVITIDNEAENTIVVSPGANMRLTPAHIEENAHLISGSPVVLAQLEIPVDTVIAAAETASGTFVLNPAPAQNLPGALMDRIDVLVPNRSELVAISGFDNLADVEEVVSAASAVNPGGATLVTLGGDGTVLVVGGIPEELPAFDVDAIDPTGAGDTFCGALAACLSSGIGLRAAVRFASAAGALAVTSQGAQAGMPTRGDVEALLNPR